MQSDNTQWLLQSQIISFGNLVTYRRFTFSFFHAYLKNNHRERKQNGLMNLQLNPYEFKDASEMSQASVLLSSIISENKLIT
jgi:hypothetical protein